MLDWLRARIHQGTRTSPFPLGESEFPERFRGRPTVEPAPGAPPFDVGACLFSPEEAGDHPTGAVRFECATGLAGVGRAVAGHGLRRRVQEAFQAGRSERFSATTASSRSAAPALWAVASQSGNPLRTIEMPIASCSTRATSRSAQIIAINHEPGTAAVDSPRNCLVIANTADRSNCKSSWVQFDALLRKVRIVFTTGVPATASRPASR